MNAIDNSELKRSSEALPEVRTTGTINSLAPAKHDSGYGGFGFISGEDGVTYQFNYLGLDPANNQTPEQKDRLRDQFNSLDTGSKVTFVGRQSKLGPVAEYIQPATSEPTATTVVTPAVSTSVANILSA